jgi:oxygen-independent coproporphyrinogen-3 oxidase
MSVNKLPPLSLYIHVPWCIKKCPYCDFNSHEFKQAIPEDIYIDRLIFDLEQEIPNVTDRKLTSIFIGGGTPSLLSPNAFRRLLKTIPSLVPFEENIEITLEANPGTFEAEKFNGFRDAGINRLSMGVQSFNDSFLNKLGRIHNASEAINAFDIARSAGFDNINIDLMYALPGQSIEQAMQDLNQAIQLSPEHISWYQLTLEPNTYFYRYPPSLPSDESIINISESGIKLLTDNDYQQYEVSAYSRSVNRRSEHNLNYWQFGDYLGIGAGAHQKLTSPENKTITRKSKQRLPSHYMDKNKDITASEKNIELREIPLEFMMNILRLKEGVKQELFSNYTSLKLSDIETQLQKAEEMSLLECKNGFIKTTKQGYNFLNDVLQLFMPENFSHLEYPSKINVTMLSDKFTG